MFWFADIHFYENVLMSFILSPYVYIHYRQRIKERIVHDKKSFKKKFKDGIIAVSFALNVGYSIENAFGQAVDELTLMYGGDSDIVVKFKHIVIRLGQNENLEDILDDFAEESKVEDIMYFAEIFRYAKRSGGDLMAVIKNTAQIIQQKEEVMSEVDTIISGKKNGTESNESYTCCYRYIFKGDCQRIYTAFVWQYCWNNYYDSVSGGICYF